MSKFLSYTELYETIQQLSSRTEEILWVSSLQLGTNAHKIFSQEILKKPPSNVRFVFPLTDITVENGEINPYEIQFLRERFRDSVKAYDGVHSNIFIFDNLALVTSADLTESAFTNSLEVGVALDGPEVEKIKTFFTQNIWQNAKSVCDLRNQKKIWNLSQNKAVKQIKRSLKRAKTHTNITDWSDECTNTWYIGILNRFPSNTVRKIIKETNLGNELLIVGDVGYNAFRELRLGDLTYIADFNKLRGKILIQIARVYDKIKAETDDGDLHLAGQVLKNFVLERNQFFDLLKKISIRPRAYEAKLNADQLRLLSETLATIKTKRKKSKNKPPKSSIAKKAKTKKNKKQG
jgi:hypothetical protein